jgi:hypothetical protein
LREDRQSQARRRRVPAEDAGVLGHRDHAHSGALCAAEGGFAIRGEVSEGARSCSTRAIRCRWRSKRRRRGGYRHRHRSAGRECGSRGRCRAISGTAAFWCRRAMRSRNSGR